MMMNEIKEEPERICQCNTTGFTRKSGVGIGVCWQCGLDSCGYFGCFVKGHNCKNMKVTNR